MFTGIIEALGEVADLQLRESEWRLTVRSTALDFGDVRLGDSIAVNGACLTVTRLGSATFEADVSNETMQLTTLNALRPG
ncbi:MAG: riboflavin synthase, partial [Pseudomonas sp.]